MPKPRKAQEGDEQGHLFAGLEFALRAYQPGDEKLLAPIHTLAGLSLDLRHQETDTAKARFSKAVQSQGHHFVIMVRGTIEGCVSYSPTGDVLVAAVSERYFSQSQPLIARLQTQQEKYSLR